RLGLLALRSKDAATAKAQFESCLGVREKLARQDKVNDRRQMEYMLALAHCGKHTEAATVAQRVQAGKPDGELLIDVARCYAWCAEAVPEDAKLRSRYRGQAIQALQKAVYLGYRDKVYLTSEPDLDPLRNDPAFAQLMEKLVAAPQS